MRYYLDTVTIRKLSRELSSLNKPCYTSALCVFEIISGMSQSEYPARKKALANLFASGIPIIWALPEEMKTNAFPIVEIVEHRTSGLRNISLRLLDSTDFEDFALKSRDELYSLDFFSHLDSVYSTGFINGTNRGNQNLKKIFNHIKEKDGEDFEKIAKEYLKSLAANPINRQITINAIADYLADHVNKSGDQMEVSELIQSYNGSIDVFINAFSLFTIQKSALLNTPSKNDFVDLHHLLYLKNDGKDFIVTDDKMILEITSQSLSIQEFKKMLAVSGL